MALFKILKGSSSRISTDVTPFHDGYAYFTPEDSGFYIDSEDDGVQTRHRINPTTSSGGSGNTCKTYTIPAEGWVEGEAEGGYYWFEHEVADADVAASDMVQAMAADFDSMDEIKTVHEFVETTNGSLIFRSNCQHYNAINLKYEICKDTSSTAAASSMGV